MSTTGLQVFDQTLQLTNIWLKSLMEKQGWTDRHRAYLALRATLHALRDRMNPDEAAHLGAQLPMLVRGFYFEGWHPAGKPLKERSKGEFLAHIRKAMPGDPDLDPERIARGVFSLLADRVTAGEIADVKQTLPKGVRELWPA